MTSRKLEIKYVPIDAVKPWGRNPKKHNKKAIVESLKRFKPTQPILVQKGTGLIIAGHGRLEAFKELGYQEVPIIELEMNDAEARAYALVDNQTVIAGGWDDDLLLSNLQELKLELPELDMSIFGFSDKQSGKKGEEDDFDVDAALASDVEPITRPGDLIILGEHRLLCGDSTKEEDVERLMGGQKARVIVTSPPYFNQREYSQWDTYSDFLEFIDAIIEGIKNASDPESSVVCWNMGSSESTNNFIPADNYFQFLRQGYKWIEWIVWNKEAATWTIPRSQHISKGIYIPALKWESISIYLMGRRPHFEPGDVNEVREWQENVWDLNRVVSSKQKSIGHPAIFPVEIPYRCIKSFSRVGDAVYEPFCGSGTTLIACEMTGRRGYGMEINPRYCDVIVQRWEAFTNKRAVRP